MSNKEFIIPYWLDEATGICHAKDCPECGGSGELRDGNPDCGECHGSGVIPNDECPKDVAKLIQDDNQRRVFNADEDWDYSEDDEDSDYEGQECSVCGYDLNRDGECTGNGCGADLCS